MVRFTTVVLKLARALLSSFFHKTAASSNAYHPLMAQLDGVVPTFAFDTVNYGESFRTTRPPSIRYITETLLEAIDNLGIEQFHTFGHHTGASIASEMAAIAPDRVLSVIANGPNFTTEEENRRSLERFAIPNPISVQGTQIIWAWSRIKDNYPVPLWKGSSVKNEVVINDNLADFRREFTEFIFAWNRVERGLRSVLVLLTGQQAMSHILTAELGNGGLKNAVMTFARHLMSSEEATSTGYLVTYFDRLLAYRNYYVHGIRMIILGIEGEARGVIEMVQQREH